MRPRFSLIPEDVEEKFYRRENAGTVAKDKKTSSKSSDKNQISVNDLSTEELAKLVIKGKFGNGKARKEALGDRFSEVQKKVNELLSGSPKKAKVNDERGGKKEVEIPSWVGRSDEENFKMQSVAPSVPESTRDISISDEERRRISNEDETSADMNIPDEYNNASGLDFDGIVNRVRRANRMRW